MTGCSEIATVGSVASTLRSLGQGQRSDLGRYTMPDAHDPDDAAAFVVLDDESATSPSAAIGHGLNGDAQRYLRAQGVADPAVWSAYRLGLIDAGAVARFGLIAQRRLRGGGVTMPTFQPDDGNPVVGLIRLLPGQNKHRFVTPPAGVGCPSDIASAARVVLTDTPLLGLRLAQLRVRGVAIVEDVAALAPIAEWLAAREIVLAGYKPAGIARMRAALGALAERAGLALLPTDLAQSSEAALERLGLDRLALVADEPPPPPVTPHLLRDLYAYAVACIDRGQAAAALASLGFDSPSFVASMRVGFVPADFRAALAPEHGRALAGRPIGGTVVIPAFGDDGTVVDLMAVHPNDGLGYVTATLFDEPRGLVGAPVARAFDTVIVTDGVRRAARYHQDGARNVLLLRSIADAQRNAARLRAAGVRRAEVRCHKSANLYAAALRAAGIEAVVVGAGAAPDIAAPVAEAIRFPDASAVNRITADAAANASAEVVADAAAGSVAPQQPEACDDDRPVLADHDDRDELAEFRVSDLAYVVGVPWDERTLIDVRASRGAALHRGEVDVALDVQRRRYAVAAAKRLDVAAHRIERHLAAIHGMLADLAAGKAQRRRLATLPAEDAGHDEAMVLLRSVDLLDRVVALTADLGWHGEDETKRLAFLAALSRKLDDPVWLALTAETSIASPIGLHVIAEATPPEDRIQVTHLSDHALLHADPAALTHRLLVVDDLERISPAVATSLRVLRARGAVSATQVERDPLRGQVRTRFIEARGPIALLGTAAFGRIDPRLAATLVEVRADESPLQVAGALEAQRRRRGDASLAGRNAARVAAARRLLHAAQRLVEPLPVVIPDAEVLAVPAGSPRARRDQQALLGLASASALLHQHQRLRDGGCVVAAPADLALARRLAGLWSTADVEPGLSPQAARVLAVARASGRERFTMEDLAAWLPGWSRHGFRMALVELAKVEFIAAPASGRGKLRTYALIGSPRARYDGADNEVGELAGRDANLPPTPNAGVEAG